jgi:hypothetical protein
MSDLQDMESGYAPVNGIQIYYQLHGRKGRRAAGLASRRRIHH